MVEAGVLYFNVTAHPTIRIVVQISGCQLAKEEVLVVSEEGRYLLTKAHIHSEMVTGTRYHVSDKEGLYVHLTSVKKGAFLTFYCSK